MPKKILNQDEINSIVIEYQKNIIGIESLATKYRVGKIKIRSILEQNNIPIKGKGAQVTIGNSSEIEQSKIGRYEPSSKDKTLIAVCKKTGKKYDDINNLSGTLTRHIIDFYGDVAIPKNTYQRKKHELITGKKWFEKYFDIKEVDSESKLKCPYCEWGTNDIENNSGSITKHIMSIHSKTISDLINEFPEFSNKFKTVLNTTNIKNSFNDSNSVVCLECGDRFLGLTHNHLKSSHNMNFDDYKNKYGENIEIFSVNTSKTLSNLAIKTNENMEHTYVSKAQREIYDYIISLGVNAKLCDKKRLGGVEIDILIDELNIGFEYNGLVWHSERYGKHEKYHLGKTDLASENNINLYHIFEDEWINKKDIVKSRIKHIIGKSSDSIYGRKCVIREITTSDKKDYLEKNHIQGNDNSTIRLGLFYNNNLVGVMTFSKPRKSLGYNKTNDNAYELVRFASNNVIGGADKLLKYFIKQYNPTKIISYADRRWSQGNLYEKLGFDFLGSTKPNYWYTKDYKKREHRFNYRKDILVSMGYDSKKTENEIMQELGYTRIWDCGSYKYELNIS